MSGCSATRALPSRELSGGLLGRRHGLCRAAGVPSVSGRGITMCAQISVPWRSLSCALAGSLLATGAARGQLVADSVAGFSGTQGQSGWWYGFYDGDPPTPFTPADF